VESMLMAVVVASFLGSGHCAGMCGPMAVLSSMGPASAAELARRMSYYHLGRLIGYLSLGALIGGLGQAIDWGGELAGWQRLAAIGAGACMVMVGMAKLVAWFRRSHSLATRKSALQRPLEAIHRRIQNWRPAARAWGIGLLTVLLPCGWLYAFLITAAGSGSPLGGALIMAAFWLGTVPALAIIPLGMRPIAGRWRAYLPALAASLLIATGTFTLVVRAEANISTIKDSGMVKRTVEQERLRVESLPGERMPCCHAE
jgi:uncharacterized protein